MVVRRGSSRAVLEVIGLGFGRTATRSLQQALERLGFGPCHHMSSLRTDRSLVEAWLAIARGESADWDRMFSGFRAAVDWPTVAYWRELVARYPEAKIVLTVRDPAQWYASAYETIYRYTAPQPGRAGAVAWVEDRLSPFLRRRREICRRVIWDGTFGGRFSDREHAIEVFNGHNAAVQRAVDPERLLVFQVSQGWEPLCEFLGAPVPDAPFPQHNTAARFQQAQERTTPLRWTPLRRTPRPRPSQRGMPEHGAPGRETPSGEGRMSR